MTDKIKLAIEFDSREAAEHFGTWLCESGEQSYWEWMRYREPEEPGPITATQFHYHAGEDTSYPVDDKRRYRKAKFLGDLTIRTTCGRLDEDDSR